MEKEIKEYLAWKATYTARAYINYRPWIIRFGEHFDNRKLSEIKIEDIAIFRKYLDDHYQPYTIQFAMIVVQNFFKFCRMQGKECINPQLIKAPKTLQKSYRAVRREDYKKILETLHCDTVARARDDVMIRLLWDTGMRVSELVGLNVSDISSNERYTVISTKKTTRRRQIFWSGETHFRLRKYIELRNEKTNIPALFIGVAIKKYTRITTRSVQRIVKKISKRAGVQTTVTPHSFRHGKAHHILERGGNPKHVQAILGHSEKNPGASFVYLQLQDKELERYAQKFLK